MLFLPSASSEDGHGAAHIDEDEDNNDPPVFFEPPGPRGNELFEIDDEIFDILPSSSPPHSVGKTRVVAIDEDIRLNNTPYPKSPHIQAHATSAFPRGETDDVKEMPEPASQYVSDETDMYRDDLAELEAWWDSGAVVIVDNVDSD